MTMSVPILLCFVDGTANDDCGASMRHDCEAVVRRLAKRLRPSEDWD
jgi:hypothetical protein